MPVPTLQIGFAERLKQAEAEVLMPALLQCAAAVPLEELDRELLAYAGEEHLRPLREVGLRGELVYAVPGIIRRLPSLLGYYRLLLGFSCKEYYKGPFAKFARCEEQCDITRGTEPHIDALCKSLCESAWILILELPRLSTELFQALTFLTLGAQFRGSYNNVIGQKANKQLFDAIRAIVKPAIEEDTTTALVIRNAANRLVRIEFAPDPDIAVREELPSGAFNERIAIEIKGGRDVSNIHNRLGEAEKSHQKAREKGYSQRWTLVNVPNLDPRVAATESPTTTNFFRIDDIVNSGSKEHARFRELLLSDLGLKQ